MSFIYYHNITGGLIRMDEATDAVIATVRGEFTDEQWKRGYSRPADGPSQVLRKRLGDLLLKEITGTLKRVEHHVNTDSNQNQYEKMRVYMEDLDGGDLAMSLDIKEEFTQRLLVKLEACKPGDVVTISGFAEMVEREINGRKNYFANHVATLKRSGAEVKALKSHFRECQDFINAQVENMKKSMTEQGLASMLTPAYINQIKRQLKTSYYNNLLKKVQEAYASAPQSEQSNSEPQSSNEDDGEGYTI